MTERFVQLRLFLARHRKIILVLAAVFVVAAVFMGGRLKLNEDFTDILPMSAPAIAEQVKALKHIRQADRLYIDVATGTTNAEQLADAAGQMTAALREIPQLADVRGKINVADMGAAYQQLQAAFSTIHPELEDASRILGATRLQSLIRITAPLLRTGVIATWCFIFIGVMRELSAAIVLFTSQTKVLSVLIYDLNESGDLAAISVLGIAMLVITFAVVLAVNQIPVFGANAGARLRN